MDSASSRSPLDDGEIVDDDSKEFNDGYDENLMGDEEDRRRLALMTEKEREQELFNRSERRETLRIRFEIERKLRTKAKKREQAEKKPPKQVRSRKRLRASEIYSSDGSSEESDEYTPDANSKILNEIKSGKSSNPKMTTRQSALASSSSSSSSISSVSSDSSSSDSEPDNGAFEDDDQSQNTQDDFEMTLQDLRSIQLRRDRIEEWIYAPFFDETAKGLFVKISIGQREKTLQHIYKVAEIIEIRQGKTYSISEGKNRTDKHCVVRIGQVDRTYAMSFVSNRVFDQEDYDKWRDQLSADGQEMPTRERFNKKKQDLYKAINYEYQESDFDYQIKEKKRFNIIPTNLASEKADLLNKRADAEQDMNYELVEKIQAQIDKLEERARELEKQRSSEKFSGISIVNERNRAKNIIESERVLKENKNVKTEDPFTRRKCTPTIVHNKNNTSTSLDPTKQNNDKNGQTTNGTTSNDKNHDGNEKNHVGPDHKSVNDLFQVHSSIDLEIDIDI